MTFQMYVLILQLGSPAIFFEEQNHVKVVKVCVITQSKSMKSIPNEKRRLSFITQSPQNFEPDNCRDVINLPTFVCHMKSE